MRNTIALLIISMILFACTSKKVVIPDVKETVDFKEEEKIDTAVYVVKSKTQMELAKGKNALVYGTIIQEDFVNKAGKSTGIKETLLKLEDGETVHIRNRSDITYFYPDYVNKKVKLKAVIFYGGIDSDNPEHQSRIGYRIDYTFITIID